MYRAEGHAALNARPSRRAEGIKKLRSEFTSINLSDTAHIAQNALKTHGRTNKLHCPPGCGTSSKPTQAAWSTPATRARTAKVQLGERSIVRQEIGEGRGSRIPDAVHCVTQMGLPHASTCPRNSHAKTRGVCPRPRMRAPPHVTRVAHARTVAILRRRPAAAAAAHARVTCDKHPCARRAPRRFSLVSVVFPYSAAASDARPASPMMFTATNARWWAGAAIRRSGPRGVLETNIFMETHNGGPLGITEDASIAIQTLAYPHHDIPTECAHTGQ